jgi:dipeptidyl aminopeptidase/acylaminoacyl peptidase
MLPSRPIDWITPEPVHERVRYPTRHGDGEGDLYRPGSAGPHPGLVVCLGVVPFGVEHPQVPRLGAALARAGFAVLLYWSPTMRDERLDPEDIRDIALAYRWLIAQPFIDPDRSGLLGTCVGGSFALMAAAQAEIRDDVAFVVAWAPYASMRTLARDVASATTSTTGGSTKPWSVDPLTRRVYVRTLTALLEPSEAERLCSAACECHDVAAAISLSADGHVVWPLLTPLDGRTAERAVQQLPARMHEWLEAMSPVRYLDDIRAPLIVLAHDRDDTVIPIGESWCLVGALTGRAGVRFTEFTMFQHLDPTKVRLPPLALARELIKFLRCVFPLFRQAVAA